MKRFGAILFLLLYLYAGTESKQLIKVLFLVDHYTEHKATTKNISFFEFLYMHYAGDDHNNNDNDRDMQLPFKSFDNSAFLSSVDLPPCTGNPHFRVDMITELYSSDPVNAALPSSLPDSIWQPPKSC